MIALSGLTPNQCVIQSAQTNWGIPADPVGDIPSAPGFPTEVVDEAFGPLTCAALRRALNEHGADLEVDGRFGPETKSALQRHLGVEVEE